MPGLIYSSGVSGISTGTALKTLMELQTGANIRAKLKQWSISFNGTSGTATPILVELTRATAAITGTAGTEGKRKDLAGLASVAMVHTATAEGTPSDVLESYYVHPQGVPLVIQYPLGEEIEVPVSSFLRVRVTAVASVSAAVTMAWEE